MKTREEIQEIIIPALFFYCSTEREVVEIFSRLEIKDDLVLGKPFLVG